MCGLFLGACPCTEGTHSYGVCLRLVFLCRACPRAVPAGFPLKTGNIGTGNILTLVTLTRRACPHVVLTLATLTRRACPHVVQSLSPCGPGRRMFAGALFAAEKERVAAEVRPGMDVQRMLDAAADGSALARRHEGLCADHGGLLTRPSQRRTDFYTA